MSDGGSITLADGTVIDMQTGTPRGEGMPGHVIVPTHDEAVKEVTRVRRRLADLPDVPEKMNIIGAVCSYYLFGLDDWEIAHAVGCTERQIGNIKMTAAFTDMVDAMRQNIVDGQAEDVRSLLARHAQTAATTMINELASPNGQNRIVAAKDVLDRAGHRPNDVVEHRHRIEGGLTIEYVSKKDDELPVINLNAEDIT